MNQEQNIQTTEELQPELAIDPTRFEHWKRNAESQQNLQLGILAGSVAAIVGAIVWAAITVLTGYQIGYMAVGIGFLVGYAVRYFGKGLTNIFSITGAVLALVGCLLGNLFSTCGFLSIQESIPFFDVFSNVMTQFDVMLELLKVTFSPMDLLFYGIAIYEGYKLSTRQITQTELQDITKQV